MQNRTLARGIAIATLAAFASGPSLAADKLRVGKASPTSSPMLPVDVGVKTGIFARHGLEVEIVNFGGGAKLHQAEAADAIDIGVGAGPELALIAKGSPELAICNATLPPLFIGIAVGEDSKLRSLAELKGAKLGITSVGSLTYWLALELARVRGWGPDGVTPVAIGGEPAAIVSALRTHAVDAAIVATALAFEMEEAHQGRLLEAVDYEGNMSSGTIFATKKLIASNPDAVRRFIAGWLDVIAFIRANKAETVKIAAEMNGFSEAVQTREYDLTLPMYSSDCKFDAESLATLQRSFADLKLLDGPVDMKTLYTEEFLPQR